MNHSSPIPAQRDLTGAAEAPLTGDAALLDEQLRAIRALGILLESRLIDEAEYERRAALFGAEAEDTGQG
jgi:hypothetical protein